MIRRLAHLSDLHIGRDVASDATALGLVAELLAADIDHVVVTGDITHRGLRTEHRRFHDTFAPLAAMGRVTVVPGNHDRLSDDVRDLIMPGDRVQLSSPPGLYLVRIDSTGMHNRRWMHSHGVLSMDDIDAAEALLQCAPPNRLRGILLHHHPIELPHDTLGEALVTWLGLPFLSELPLGQQLLDRVAPHCDLILHGHRHTPMAMAIRTGNHRRLHVFNAGSSTELMGARILAHEDGHLLSAGWLAASASEPVLPERRRPKLVAIG